MTPDRLRTLILKVARDMDAIGGIEESVKSGQPSFAPADRKAGSSVRIQSNDDGSASLMVICSSPLADLFRERHGDRLDIRGDREVRLTDGCDEDAVRDCVALAFTYKR